MTQEEKTTLEDYFIGVLKDRILLLMTEKYIHHLTKYVDATFLTRWYHGWKMRKYYDKFIAINNQFNKQ